MQLEFISESLRDACSSREEMVRRWGPAGELVAQRLLELYAADTVADLRLLPHLSTELPGIAESASACTAMLAGDGMRISFEAADRDVDETFVWDEVSAILIVDVVIRD